MQQSVTQARSNVTGLLSIGRLYSSDSFISQSGRSLEESTRFELSNSINLDLTVYEDWTQDEAELFSDVELPLDIGVAIEYLKVSFSASQRTFPDSELLRIYIYFIHARLLLSVFIVQITHIVNYFFLFYTKRKRIFIRLYMLFKRCWKKIDYVKQTKVFILKQ